MRLLTPHFIFKNVTRITPAFLQQQGIKALVLDVDNTLTEHGSQLLRPEIENWLATMRENGVRLGIVSNNFEKRVGPFAGKLGLDYVSFSCKPFPRGLAVMRRKWGVQRSEMALVGDQIYTDALAARLYGVRVLLVKPLAEDIKPGIRFKRHLEAPVISRYYKKGGKLL
ncbi:MAG: YqeG family HAD IIIA-type phosphatase [Oscillospiraceae bacterium]